MDSAGLAFSEEVGERTVFVSGPVRGRDRGAMPKLVAAGVEVGQGAARQTSSPVVVAVDAIRNLAKTMNRLRAGGRAIYVSGIGSKYPTQTMLLADASGVVEVKTGLRGQVGRRGHWKRAFFCGRVWNRRVATMQPCRMGNTTSP